MFSNHLEQFFLSAFSGNFLELLNKKEVNKSSVCIEYEKVYFPPTPLVVRHSGEAKHTNYWTNGRIQRIENNK